MPMRVIVFLLCGLLALLAYFALGGDGEDCSPGVSIGPREASVPPVEPEEDQGPESRAPAASTPTVEQQTATEFLQSFWGEDWPEVQKRLGAAAKNLEGRPPPTVKWEEAAKEIEKRLPLEKQQRDEYRKNLLRWSGVVDDPWLRQQFDRTFALDEFERAGVEQIVAKHHIEAEALADEFLAGLDRAVHDAWYSGRFVHAPFTTLGAPGAERKGFYSKGDGEAGWAASLALTWEDCPDLEAIHDRIRERIRLRDREVLEYIKIH